MGFIQVAMIILAIVSAIVGFCNIDSAIKDHGNARNNLMIAGLLCILMGLGAFNVSEYREAHDLYKSQATLYQDRYYNALERVNGYAEKLSEARTETEKVQMELMLTKRAKDKLELDCKTFYKDLKEAEGKLERIQKLVEDK